MPVRDLCAGVSCDDDVEECDESLECIDEMFNTNRSLLSTNNVEGHFFCKRADLYQDNGEYDYIDRSDETKLITRSDSRKRLPHFPPCTVADDHGNPGL